MFVLKRIRESPTHEDDECFALDSGIIRFGRHTGNDYNLHSPSVPCFISRWHAEIKRSDDGQYSILDGSRNGTYVNNIRVHGENPFILSEGDIITFGYFGGHSVLPGQRVIYETIPEFKFKFMRISDIKHCRLKPKNNASSAADASVPLFVKREFETKLEPKIQAKSEAKLEPKIKADVDPKIEADVEPKIKADIELKIEADIEPKTELKIEPKLELKSEPKIEPKLEPKIEPKTEPELAVKIEASNDDLHILGPKSMASSKESYINKGQPITASESAVSSQTANDSEISEIVRKSISQAEKFGQSDSEVAEFDVLETHSGIEYVKSDSIQSKSLEMPNHLTSQEGCGQSPNLLNSSVQPQSCSISDKKEKRDNNTSPQSTGILNQSASSTDRLMRSTNPGRSKRSTVQPTNCSKLNKDKTGDNSSLFQSSDIDSTREFDRTPVNTESNPSSGTSTKRSLNKRNCMLRDNSNVKNSDTTASISLPDKNKNVPTTQRKGRSKTRTVSPVAPRTSLSTAAQDCKNSKKRKSEGPVNTRGKRKGASNSSDDMFHSDGDICSAPDCKRPIAKKVAWVQCDDCDAWYHVPCINRLLSDLDELEKSEFHCGCS